MDKTKQQLTVLSIDNYFRSVKQLATISAKVEEEGVIEITDKKTFDVIFDSVDVEKPIQISSDGSAIYVENQDGDWYKRRIVGDKSLEEIFEKKDELFNWVEQHSLVKVDGKDVWKFTPEQGSALYPMRIKTTRKNLMKFVKDTLKLTKDNATVILSENGTITISTGQPNSTTMAKHKLEYESIGTELINFAVKFSALQAIVPNLLEDVILNFRMQSSGIVVMRIESFDKNMKQVLSLGSQDKNGVIYDETEQIEVKKDGEEQKVK